MNRNFEKFIDNARAVHGYKYDYLEYINMRTHITLSHEGVTMSQCPKKHLMGRCPEKNIDKKTTEEFIQEAILVWDNKFDYSNTVYNGSLNKIIFYDYKGNQYEQRATSHLEGVVPKYKIATKYSDDDVARKSKEEIIEFLEKNSIEFFQDYKFDDCDCKMGFDFYLPKIRTCIEFYSQDDYGMSYRKNDNKMKIEYCEDNYINLVKLTYKHQNIIWELMWDNFKKNV